MGDFEEKLNAILSNPEAMSQVMNLAQSLNLNGSGGGETAQENSPPPPKGGESAGLGEMANLGNLLGQIDPNMLQRVLPLVKELAGDQNDERMQLLYALRPFLRPERRDKVEQAARTAKLIHVGRKLLGTMGERHV